MSLTSYRAAPPRDHARQHTGVCRGWQAVLFARFARFIGQTGRRILLRLIERRQIAPSPGQNPPFRFSLFAGCWECMMSRLMNLNQLLKDLLKLQSLDDAKNQTPGSEKEIAALRGNIPPMVLGHYDRLRAHGKLGVIAVRNQVCTGSPHAGAAGHRHESSARPGHSTVR